MTDQDIVRIRKEVTHRDFRAFAFSIAFARAIERQIHTELNRVWTDTMDESLTLLPSKPKPLDSEWIEDLLENPEKNGMSRDSDWYMALDGVWNTRF